LTHPVPCGEVGTLAMRQTLPTILALLLSAGAVVYALLVVASDVRHVSEELDALTHDVSGMTDDVRSLADDVNAIADALAGEEDDDDHRQSPAGVTDAAVPQHAHRIRTLAAAPRLGSATRHHLHVHRAVARAEH
jgi:outer membrane murein-binding lipoprotein Lpp